jgi:outer membrane protein assembly factor BamE (lipoprotein component of BamABCDE complex)
MKGIEAGINRAKLDKLQIHMTEDQVRAIMGKPYRTEATDRAKVWLYITEWQPDYYTTADEMTALVFENGKLVAWGAAPEQLQKYEIRLR